MPDHFRLATTRDDVEAAATTIANAFCGLAVSKWLVPDPVERPSVLRAAFRIKIEHALQYGQVQLMTRSDGEDSAQTQVGAAVWFTRGNRPTPEPARYAWRMREATGEHARRFEALDGLAAAHHPNDLGPHQHLVFLAADPQELGIGAALLRRHLETTRLPSYLEASSLESRRFYARHDYLPIGSEFSLPGGAVFYPMWRPVSAQKDRQETVSRTVP
jgi:hypothetical protein